jgi:hypothetical integral membrane protein (TIGR02206 family)
MLDSNPPVELFGIVHVGALLATVGVGVALSVALRRRDSASLELAVRIGVASFLVVMTTLHVLWVLDNREPSVWEFIPLHLCDLSIFVALYALLTKQRLAAALLYFWTCSGTALAMVLPAIDRGFPSLRFFIYFSLHGAVVVSALVLVYGMRLYPDRRSPLRVFGLTLIYGAVVILVDLASGQNYLFLAHKPPEETMLDYMGPWPIYILVTLAIGLGLFYLLNVPFRKREPGSSER